MSYSYILAAFLLLSQTFGTGNVPVNAKPEILLNQNNMIRLNIGKPALALDATLNFEAQHHANYMASTGDFGHRDFANDPRIRERMFNGFPYVIKENITMMTQDPFGAWCDCYPSRIEGQLRKPHYETLTGDFNVCGFGVAYSKDGTPYWCALYSKVNLQPSPPDNKIAP